MPALAEALRGLYGAWRLLLLDRHGILAFEGSRQAALRSFWVAVLSLPLAVAANFIPIGKGEEGIMPRGIGMILADCMLSWLLPLIVIYVLVRWYGRSDRYWLLLAALNWSQVPQAVLYLISTALFLGAGQLVDPDAVQGAAGTAALAGGVMALLAMLLFAGIIFYEWFIAWIALEAGVALPTAAVLFDLVIGYGVTYGLDRLALLLEQSGHGA
jgi:hypothetical protein